MRPSRVRTLSVYENMFYRTGRATVKTTQGPTGNKQHHIPLWSTHLMYLNHSILRAVCLLSRCQFFPSPSFLSCVDSKWDVFSPSPGVTLATGKKETCSEAVQKPRRRPSRAVHKLRGPSLSRPASQLRVRTHTFKRRPATAQVLAQTVSGCRGS